MPFVSAILTAFIVVLVAAIVKKLTSRSEPRLDVVGPDSEHWLKGNYHRVFVDGWEYNHQLTEKYGHVVRIHAMLGEEQLLISDPRALHHIVVKEQDVYEETEMFIKGNLLLFGEGLISTLGEQHKKQRKMLNPVFSLANMRDLLPVIQPIADTLLDIFTGKLPVDSAGSEEIDVVPWMSRGALEYICQAGLGYTFSALDQHRTTPYIEALRGFTPAVLPLMLVRPFIPLIMRNFSLYWRNKIVDWAPMRKLREAREVVMTIDGTSRRVLSAKMEKAQKQGGANEDVFEEHYEEVVTNGKAGASGGERDLGFRMKGRDIMTILMKANSSSDPRDALTESELIGQMNTIVFAGFETTTIAISRILFILASKPDVQARLRNVIRKVKQEYGASTGHSGKWEDVRLPYDVLMSIPYLDAIIRETLRVYPPTSLLSRTTRRDTVLPLQFPVRTRAGAETTAIPLPKGTTVIISILASNHNKLVWGEDASEWRPERWLTPSGERIGMGQGADLDGTLGEVVAEGVGEDGAAAVEVPGTKGGVKFPGVYASMMTFLGGGRACIGFKFAEMEIKQVLTTLLPTLHFALPDKEIYWKMNGLQVPVVRPPHGDNTKPQVPLKVRRVTEADFV